MQPEPGYDQFIEDEFQPDGTTLNGGENTRTTQKMASILDGLTEHRADRVQILLANLPNEDLVHIVKDKIPAFLRIQKDVQAKREHLDYLYRQYQEYDIADMDEELRAKLQNMIQTASADFDQHQETVGGLLAKANKTNQNSLSL